MLVPQSRISYLAPGSLQHSSEHDRRNRVSGRPFISLPFFHATPLPGLMVFSNFFHFECNFFKDIPSTTSPNAIFHASWYFFCTSLFLILLFGHLGDQCAFGLVVLVSLRLCINFPSPTPILYVYYRFVAPTLVPEIRPYVAHVCFYPDA